MRRVSLAALLLAGGAVIPAATAQDAPVLAESTLTATISQSIEADTNYDLEEDSPGTTVFGDTRFGLGLVRDTETRRLRASLNTGLRPVKRPDEDLEWNLASPSSARLGFAQDFANNAFDIDLGARVQRIDRLVFDEFLFDDEGLPALPEDVTQVSVDTLEQRLDLNTGFTAGTASPSTLGFRLRATDIDYTGDNSEDFTPRTGADATALWQLRLNPVLSGAAFASYSYQEADNDQESQIEDTEFDLGVIYQPREDVSVTVGAGYALRERRATIGDERVTVEDEAGLSLRAAGRYETEETLLGFNLRYTTAAPSDRISGSLNASFQRPRGVITARLFQDFGFGADAGDEERRVTGLGLGYTYALNSVSGLGLTLNAANSAAAEDEGDDDRSRVDFTAQYNRSLTQVVDASLGYQLTQRFDDPTDATSHRVFFQIGRSFVTGF